MIQLYKFNCIQITNSKLPSYIFTLNKCKTLLIETYFKSWKCALDTMQLYVCFHVIFAVLSFIHCEKLLSWQTGSGGWTPAHIHMYTQSNLKLHLIDYYFLLIEFKRRIGKKDCKVHWTSNITMRVKGLIYPSFFWRVFPSIFQIKSHPFTFSKLMAVETVPGICGTDSGLASGPGSWQKHGQQHCTPDTNY